MGSFAVLYSKTYDFLQKLVKITKSILKVKKKTRFLNYVIDKNQPYKSQ